MKVAVDGSGLARPRAGVGTYTREILSAMALARPQHRLTVFLPKGARLPGGLGGLEQEPIPATRLLGRHLDWPRRLRRFGAGAFFGPAGVLPLGPVGAPTVITVHDLAIYRNRAWFPPQQPLSTRIVVPRSLRHADAIIAVSQHTAADLVELFQVQPGRLHVVHHGVSARFRPLREFDLDAIRRRLGLPQRFVLFVGTIEPRKNLETLIEALSNMPDAPCLVIAGDWGWSYQEVRRRIEGAGEAVRVLGGLDPTDLPGVYNLATVLAHPAWYEGFGLTPLEAMACGTPVVVSDASSLPEVVGEAGLKVPPGDAGAWRRALQRILEDSALAGNLSAAGLKQAGRFGWEQAAELTWQVIEGLAGGRGARG